MHYQISVEDFFNLPLYIQEKIESRIGPNLELEIGKGYLLISEAEMFEILKEDIRTKFGSDDVIFSSNTDTSWSWELKNSSNQEVSKGIWNRVETLLF